MSREYGQTRCEDKNMEADRNKRGLGGEARGREAKRKAGSDGGSRSAEEIVLAWWPEAFQPSGHHYLSFLPLRSRVLVLVHAGEVCDTYRHVYAHTSTNTQSGTTVASSPAFTHHRVYLHMRVPVFAWLVHLNQRRIYTLSGVLIYVRSHCLLCYL